MRRSLFAAVGLALLLGACTPLEERLNQVQRTWDNSEKNVIVYSMDGTAVKTYDIGRSKVTRAEGGGDYVYFYANGKYIQTNMPYIVEAR